MHVSSYTVVTSVITSDDADILVLCTNVEAISELGIEEGLGLSRGNSIAKWMPSTLRLGILRPRGHVAPSGEDYGVILGAQLVGIDIHTDVGIGDEGLSSCS